MSLPIAAHSMILFVSLGLAELGQGGRNSEGRGLIQHHLTGHVKGMIPLATAGNTPMSRTVKSVVLLTE